MAQLTRGGRAALDRLRDDLASIRQASTQAESLGETASAKVLHNPRYSQELLQRDQREAHRQIQQDTANLLLWIDEVLEPLLQRQAEKSDLEERIIRLEQWMAETTGQPAHLRSVK